MPNKNNIGFVIRLIGVLIIASLAVTGAAAVSLSNSGGGSWQYQRDITISNTGGALSDYQVLVSLTSGNFPTSAQNSGADIRFTDVSGTELSYWIESWDYSGRTAKIWVKVTSIASGSTTIRMYYGNPSATSSSNGQGTFMLFDDFNDGSINTALWTTSTSGSGAISESGGIVTLQAGAGMNNGVVLKSVNKFSSPYRLVIYSKDTFVSGGYLWQLNGASDDPPITLQHTGSNAFGKLAQNGDYFEFFTTAGGTKSQSIISISSGTWYRYEFKATSSAVKFTDGSVDREITTNIPSVPLSIFVKVASGGDDAAHQSSYGVSSYVDHVFLAKYVSSDPSVSVGAETSTSTPTPTPTPTTPTPTPSPSPTPTPTTPTPTPTTPTPTTPAPTTPAPTTPSTTLAVKQPMLTVSHTTLKEEPEVGEEVLITVTVQNNGEGTAKNIRLTEQLPSSISVSFIDGAISNTPNLVTWNGELAPNRAHAIIHTLTIVEKKSRAIPVIVRYEDEAGNQRETSTTIYVEAVTPAPTKAPETQTPIVRTPAFTALLVLIGLLAAILLVRRR